MRTIPEIAHQLRIQDNHITANPIFLCQQKRRVYGLEESDTYIWVDESGEEVDDEKAAKLDREYDDYDPYDDASTDGTYRRSYYRDEWVFVQPFFTHQGARDYIAINAHNLREPRVYVESGYRNHEWAAVREHLMEIT